MYKTARLSWASGYPKLSCRDTYTGVIYPIHLGVIQHNGIKLTQYKSLPCLPVPFLHLHKHVICPGPKSFFTSTAIAKHGLAEMFGEMNGLANPACLHLEIKPFSVHRDKFAILQTKLLISKQGLGTTTLAAKSEFRIEEVKTCPIFMGCFTSLLLSDAEDVLRRI